MIMKGLENYLKSCINENLFRNIGADVSDDTVYAWLAKGLPSVKKKYVRQLFLVKDMVIYIHPDIRNIRGGGGRWVFTIDEDMLEKGHIPGYVSWDPKGQGFANIIFNIKGIAGSRNDWQSLPRWANQLDITSSASSLDGLEIDGIQYLNLNGLKITDTAVINKALANVKTPIISISLDGLRNIKTISKDLPVNYLIIFNCDKLQSDWLNQIGPDADYKHIYIRDCQNIKAEDVHPRYCRIMIDDELLEVGD